MATEAQTTTELNSRKAAFRDIPWKQLESEAMNNVHVHKCSSQLSRDTVKVKKLPRNQGTGKQEDDFTAIQNAEALVTY